MPVLQRTPLLRRGFYTEVFIGVHAKEMTLLVNRVIESQWTARRRE